MAQHAKLSPSSAERWMSCPGSVALIGDDQGTASHAAMLGTAAHKIVERLIDRGDTDARDYFENTILVHIAGQEETKIIAHGMDIPFAAGWSAYVADEKMIDGVQMMIDEVERAKADLDHPEVFGERFLDMTWLDPRFGGTADVTLVEAFGWVHLLDYKNGYMVVEVENNEQMKSYAVGLLHEHPDAENIRITIVQPNARHEGGAIRTVSYSRDEIKLFEIQMKHAAEATDAPNAPRRAGKWCMFCPAKTRCPEFEGQMVQSAADDFGSDPLDGLPVFGNALKINDTDLDGLARKRALVPLVEKWCKEINSAVENALMNGSVVSGFKLVQGKSNRKWNPDANVELEINKAMLGVNLTDLWEEPKFKSPAKVEKLGDSKEERKAMKALVATLVFKPPGHLTVAPEADPRAAADPSDGALADFGDDPLEGE